MRICSEDDKLPETESVNDAMKLNVRVSANVGCYIHFTGKELKEVGAGAIRTLTA